MNRHCVVLAGGLGTRLIPVTSAKIPKVLVEVAGIPFLHHKLESLRLMNISDVTLLVGELGYMVDEFLSTCSIPGLNWTVIHDGPTLLGTAGAIAKSIGKLPDEFWITYGDSYLIADLEAAEKQAAMLKADGVMVVLRNNSRLEPSNVSVEGNFIKSYSKLASANTHDWIDFGILRLKKAAFVDVPTKSPTDLSTVITEVIANSKLLAFEVFDRYWDIGSPHSYLETQKEFERRSSK